MRKVVGIDRRPGIWYYYPQIAKLIVFKGLHATKHSSAEILSGKAFCRKKQRIHMRAWFSRMALRTFRMSVPPYVALLLLSSLTLSAFANAQTDEERPIIRRPLPFVSFLEKSLLRIPATRDMSVGDFNGDGLPDLIFHTANPEVLYTSLGDGKGNFTLPKKHGFGTGYSNTVTGSTFITGDFDGDGTDEFISLQRRQISTETTEANLFLVSSSLTNEDTLVEHRSISLPGALAASDKRFLLFGADIDGDSRKDLVFSDESSRRFFAIKNSPGLWAPSFDGSDASFIAAFDTHMASIDNGPPLHVLMFDANNDGIADILKIGEDRIYLFHGDRDKFFTASETPVSPGIVIAQSTRIPFGGNPFFFNGYFDRDEFPDLFIVNNNGKCWILKNTAGNGFSFFIGLDYSDLPIIRIGDFNGDGLDDLVACGPGYEGIKVLLNNGEGGFRAVERSMRGKSIISLAVNDINSDGLSDIILTLKGVFGGLEGKVLLNISQKPEN